MAHSVYISWQALTFHGYSVPEPGIIVGYAALIYSYGLPAPLPTATSLISDRHRKYSGKGWEVFGQRYLPNDTLYGHLVFALRYEGVRLLVLKKLFEHLSQSDLTSVIKTRPNGQYARKIWFLYEWLMVEQLPLSDTPSKTGYKPLVNENQQFAIPNGIQSPRHRIINNLPGNHDFCPMVFKSQKLKAYIANDLANQEKQVLNKYAKDLLNRAASFLLLEDSKASFTIEGESPKSQRITRWGKAIGQAGTNPLSREELLRLQNLIISDDRLIELGFRRQGGFVGEHDRSTGQPIPEHISAKPEDLDRLIYGLLQTDQKLEECEIDPVIAATIVAFGFVFIHPFQDGNGRIHRYLIHHILARKYFTPQGMIFPLSAAILDHIADYRKALQNTTHPLLDYIDWQVTANNNVQVLNDTLDYYRYFDATHLAEFLYEMVQDTVDRIIPQEVQYLQRYDEFKKFIDAHFDMPNGKVGLLIRFLEQNNGKLSKRGREKEFALLTNNEIHLIEEQFQAIFENK